MGSEMNANDQSFDPAGKPVTEPMDEARLAGVCNELKRLLLHVDECCREQGMKWAGIRELRWMMIDDARAVETMQNLLGGKLLGAESDRDRARMAVADAEDLFERILQCAFEKTDRYVRLAAISRLALIGMKKTLKALEGTEETSAGKDPDEKADE